MTSLRKHAAFCVTWPFFSHLDQRGEALGRTWIFSCGMAKACKTMARFGVSYIIETAPLLCLEMHIHDSSYFPQTVTAPWVCWFERSCILKHTMENHDKLCYWANEQHRLECSSIISHHCIHDMQRHALCLNIYINYSSHFPLRSSPCLNIADLMLIHSRACIEAFVTWQDAKICRLRALALSCIIFSSSISFDSWTLFQSGSRNKEDLSNLDMTSLPPGVDPHTIPLVPPPVGVIPNFKNSPSIETTAIVVISITIGLEVFFLTVRLHSNVKKFQTLMADDCVMIETQVPWENRLTECRDGHCCNALFIKSCLCSSLL